MSCKSFSQNYTDSTQSKTPTYCFYEWEVKEFLKTKAMLNNVLIQLSKMDSLYHKTEAQNRLLEEENEIYKRQSNNSKKEKNRLEIGLGVAGGGLGIAIIYIAIKEGVK